MGSSNSVWPFPFPSPFPSPSPIKSQLHKNKNKQSEKFNSPHKWDLVSVATPNFCSHCGHMLPLGKKRVHKCLECGIYAHTRCGSLFLPDNCGQIQISSPPPNRKIEKLSKKSRSDSHVSFCFMLLWGCFRPCQTALSRLFADPSVRCHRQRFQQKVLQ